MSQPLSKRLLPRRPGIRIVSSGGSIVSPAVAGPKLCARRPQLADRFRSGAIRRQGLSNTMVEHGRATLATARETPLVRLAGQVKRQYRRDDVSGLAAELTYRTFLALFPFAIFLAALSGFI